MIKFDTDKYYFDEKAAKSFVYAIETNLVHPKGPLSGKPFILEEWQKQDIIYPLFGIKSKETGLRRFKYSYIEIAKKNGKSPLVAAILLVMLKYIIDSGAELVSLASSRDQAKIVFGDAKKMLRKGSAFANDFKLYQNAIMVNEKSYKPLSADVGTNDGGNNNVVIIDELHRFKERELVDLMEGSTAAKDDPLTLMITTAGSSLTSICYEKYEYACNVRDGIVKDDTFLPVIYEACKNDDPFIEETWIKANPNYGVSVNKAFMKEQANKAKSNKAYLNSFLRLHLNIWTDVKDIWIPDDKWQNCASKYTRDELYNILIGCKCSVGFDLGVSSDISALTLTFPPDESRDFEPSKYISLYWFWLPEEKGKDSADKNNAKYYQWVADGHIIETEGNVTDYDQIYNKIIEINENFELHQCAYDPAFAIQLASKLYDKIGEDILFKHSPQQKAMTAPSVEFENIIIDSKNRFMHDNNPVMRWMINNTILKIDPNGENMSNPLRKPAKNKGSFGKIDGVITSVISLSYWLNGEDNSEGSYLDENDVMFIEI